MSYDLILQSPRGTLLPRAERDAIVEKLLAETKLDEICEMILSNERTDKMIRRGAAKELAKWIDEGEFSREEYEKFCAARGLARESDEEADESAELFVDSKWGQSICAFCMPKPSDPELDRRAYRLAVDFARRHGLVLHDPQIGKDINFEDPGELPPIMLPGPDWGEQPGSRRGLFWALVVIVVILIGLGLRWFDLKK